jgi:hypothetical protein
MPYLTAPCFLGWTCRFCIVRGWSHHDLAMTWARYASVLRVFHQVFKDLFPMKACFWGPYFLRLIRVCLPPGRHARGFLDCPGGVPEGSSTAREACPRVPRPSGRVPRGLLAGSWRVPGGFLEVPGGFLEVPGRFLEVPGGSWRVPRYLVGIGCVSLTPEGSWRFPEM